MYIPFKNIWARSDFELETSTFGLKTIRRSRAFYKESIVSKVTTVTTAKEDIHAQQSASAHFVTMLGAAKSACHLRLALALCDNIVILFHYIFFSTHFCVLRQRWELEDLIHLPNRFRNSFHPEADRIFVSQIMQSNVVHIFIWL